MHDERTLYEPPTRRRLIHAEAAVQKSFSRFARSTGLTQNLALHALLNCFDTYGSPEFAVKYILAYEPGPIIQHSLIADDATYSRLRGLTDRFRTSANVALAMLMACFREHSGPVRVEGAGLRIPCPIGSPCAPDAPSAGLVAAKHVAPTRLKTGLSSGSVPAMEASSSNGGKATLLRALIAEEGSKTRIYRKSAALLSALVPDA